MGKKTTDGHKGKKTTDGHKGLDYNRKRTLELLGANPHFSQIT